MARHERALGRFKASGTALTAASVAGTAKWIEPWSPDRPALAPMDCEIVVNIASLPPELYECAKSIASLVEMTLEHSHGWRPSVRLTAGGRVLFASEA